MLEKVLVHRQSRLTREIEERIKRNVVAAWRQAQKRKAKAEKRTERFIAKLRGFEAVPGVTYRTSPATGLKRPIKPKPARGAA